VFESKSEPAVTLARSDSKVAIVTNWHGLRTMSVEHSVLHFLPGVIMTNRHLARWLACSLAMIFAASLFSQNVIAQDNRWAETVSRAAESVVSIQLSQLRNFSNSRQGGSNATGFVVDAERGIILTNRHVVGAGPIRLSATFQNQERVNAVPLYRDPIHDFAFIRYDPKALKYASPRSLQLRPDKVKTGMNIRVIGSDGGEQLSILNGTIARLDREVPSYGRYSYNDFNTFYLQAASSTSGGSSGSPVLDFDGDVVALNAAANSSTASSFFLPLNRIKSALAKLQQNENVPRGGLQTLFQHRPFRELRRLGLSSDAENTVRKAQSTVSGMLTVGQVLIGGVADGALIEGDVLLEIDGKIVTDFVALEALLDESIGRALNLRVVRQGREIETSVTVADLHEISPKRLVEIGDSVIQNLSIQHVRSMARERTGVVVVDAGYDFARSGVPRGSVITSAGNRRISGLDDFLEALADTPEYGKLKVGFYRPGSEYVARVAQLEVQDRWFGNRDCKRVDDARFWACDSVALARPGKDEKKQAVEVPSFRDPLLNPVGPAMVRVEFSVPFRVDNLYARHFSGTGIIVDAESGLVAVDRNTVPVGVGDADVTFFGSTTLSAQVVFLHPRHNIALLQYDTEALGEISLEAIEFVESDMLEIDDLSLVGYGQAGTLRTISIDSATRSTIGLRVPSLPRFQQTPTDAYVIPNVPNSVGGPIVDAQGRAHAMYMSFAFEEGRDIVQDEYALPASVVIESVRLYKSGQPYRSIDARLSYRSLSVARDWGLSNDWLRRYNELPADTRRVLYVEQVVPGTSTAANLNPGDVILAVNGELVSSLFAAEQRSQSEAVTLTLLSSGEVKDVVITPGSLDIEGTSRLVSWGGALFQEPMPTIGYFKSVKFPGVYIADTDDGSPALWDGLYRNRFVTAVDGEPVNNLDDLLRLLSSKQQDEVTRLSLVTMSGRKGIVTVEPEYNFWPTFEVRRRAEGWRRSNFLN